MTRGVLYMMAGRKHAVNLIVSVASLRQHYDGPVCIVCDEEAEECAYRIAAESSLGPCSVIAGHVTTDAVVPWRGNGAIHASKTLMPKVSPFSSTIYLDCDTVVVGAFDELWPDESIGEVVLTGFAGLSSTRKPILARLKNWLAYAPEHAGYAMTHDYPMVNTGVLAFCKAAHGTTDAWREMTLRNKAFSDDEVAMQLIVRDHLFIRHAGCRFNASVSFNPYEQDVRIWHCHTRMNWRTDKGREVFLPRFIDALAVDLAGIRSFPVHRYNWNSLSQEWRLKLSEVGCKINDIAGQPVDAVEMMDYRR